MLTVSEQKEILIDRLAMAFNTANKMAKFCRSLKLYDAATKYYYKASGYKTAIHLIEILEDEPNNLTFNSFP